MNQQELQKLDAREIRSCDIMAEIKKGAEYLGTVHGSYYDYNYFRLADGSFVFECFGVGD